MTHAHSIQLKFNKRGKKCDKMEVTPMIACIIISSMTVFVTGDPGEGSIVAENCSYIPSDVYLPCKQYRADSRNYCNPDWLRKRFPQLYEVNDSNTVYWPGEIEDQDARPDVIQWRPPTDGGIHYLRGFYVQLSGMSVQNFGQRICQIIDLSNTTEANIPTLINTTFVVNVKVPGKFRVKIDPLPMPPSAHKPEAVTIDKPSIPQEYYPQFSKQTFEYHQLNGTSVNLTMDLEPPLQNVNTLYMTILDHERQMIDEIPRRLFYPENYYIIDGLYEGNFTLWIRPIDQFSNDRRKCVCYKGTNGTRHMCIPCHDIETHIHVRHVKIPVPEDGTYSIRVLVGTVTGAVLTLVVILTTVFLMCRRRELPCSFIGTFTRRRKSFQVVTCPKLKIFCVFASDNPAHAKAVSAFLELVQLCRGFEIIHFDSSPSPLSLCESLFSGGFRYETVLEQADIIVVVRSAWANALLEDMELKTVYPSDAPSDDDCKFISCMHQIKQNSLYCSKTVSVLFKYSQEDTSLIGNLTGPVYSVPNDLQSFISYLYSKSEISCRVLTQSFDQERDRLVQAINMCSAYQLQNRNWLAKKMFLLKTYLSRADSGIVTQRRRTNFSISIRSRSADTVSSSRYRPECHTGQSRGRACCHNQLKRTRTLSCDFSFSAPESEKEDQSMRFSMLENKFVAINERYEYILNYKLKTEDDCYTIDGKSV